MNFKAARYKLSRRMTFRGLPISVETDKGELRHWFDPHENKSGTTKMKWPYGYIRRTEGVDGDHVDCYVGPNERAKNVYIVHQMKAPEFKTYDEDKCMLGFLTADEAKKAYLAHYNKPGFFGSMTTMPFEEFEKKVKATFEEPKKIAATAYTIGCMHACAALGLTKHAGLLKSDVDNMESDIATAGLATTGLALGAEGLARGGYAAEKGLSKHINRSQLAQALDKPMGLPADLKLEMSLPHGLQSHFEPATRTVRVSPDVTPGVMSHEFGHASGRAVPGYFKSKALGHLSGLMAAPLLYAVDPDSTAADVLTYGPSALFAPQLLEEGRASIRGFRGLRRAGGLRLAGKGVLSQLPAFLTYAAGAAAPIVTGHIVRHLRRER
jgi:hypothetical protein